MIFPIFLKILVKILVTFHLGTCSDLELRQSNRKGSASSCKLVFVRLPTKQKTSVTNLAEAPSSGEVSKLVSKALCWV